MIRVGYIVMHSFLGRRLVVLLLLSVALVPCLSAADADEDALKKAVTLYASFDEAVKADYGGGDLIPYTGVRPEPGKPKPEPTKGADPKVFTIAKGKGIASGCLEVLDILPNNGRIFFPAKGNIAFNKSGWGGAVSVWINFDPDKMLKTKFCDPIQITQKGANNGGIWFDYNDAKPRDMRHGCFPALREGEKAISEDDPKAPMVRVPKVGFKSGDWHHIVLSWKNFDTGKADAVSQFWVDGKLMGEVKDRAIAMDWDIDKAGIFVAISYIGLLDELAIFNRPLTAEEIALLQKKPGLLQPLKKAAGGGSKTAELARLLQRPPVGDPPAIPKFPFAAATAQRYQEDYAKWLGVPVEFTNDLGMTFRLVPPGTFLMGSPESEPGRSKEYDETLHQVTLTRAFYLSKHEATVGQFRRFVEATQYVTDVEKAGGGNAHDEKAVWKHRPGTQWRKPGFAGPFELKDEHPIVHVSWTDSKNFCRWMSAPPVGQTFKMIANEGPVEEYVILRIELKGERLEAEAKSVTTGKIVRIIDDARILGDVRYDLPTEAQWEWACRAGSKDRFWWGPDEDKTGKVANVGDKSLKKVHPDWPRIIMAMDDGHAFLAPVGSYQANGFGFHDMLGNVWEFCADRYRAFTKDAETDPISTDDKRGYAVRGGGWSNVPSDVRCASRNADPPHFGHSNLGFRVAIQIALRLPAKK
jgi:sulfatase modifying factor 1